MSPPRIVTWDDQLGMQTIVRLEINNKYVQRAVTFESLEDWHNPRELFAETLRILCADWHKQFGERIKAVAPEAEGQAWRIESDNTIEGEIVIHEIEGGTNASRKAIGGR